MNQTSSPVIKYVPWYTYIERYTKTTTLIKVTLTIITFYFLNPPCCYEYCDLLCRIQNYLKELNLKAVICKKPIASFRNQKRSFKFIKYPHINLCHFHFTNAVSVINEFCSKRFFKLLNKNARNVLGFNILHKMLIYIIGLIIKVQRVLFCTRTTSIGFFYILK